MLSEGKGFRLLAHFQEGNAAEIAARLTQICGALAGAADRIDTTDGLRIHFGDGDVIHLRPSGNAPELRCYTESDTAKRAAWLNEQALRLIVDHTTGK